MWAARAGEDDDGQLAKDGVDRSAAEAELAEVRAGQECSWRVEQFGGFRAGAHGAVLGCSTNHAASVKAVICCSSSI